MEWYKRFLRKNGIIGLFMTVVSVFYILLLIVNGTVGPETYEKIYYSLTLPVNVPTFAKNPWTILTYWMVTPPLWIWLLIVELSLIYTFGNILNAMVGDKRTQGILFFAILVNGLVTIALVNLLPTVEASSDASIFGLHSLNATLIAAAITLVPRYDFVIIRQRIPLIYIGAGMLIILAVSMRLIWSSMGVSVLVGALVGFVWVKVLQKGTDFSSWLQFNIGFPASQSTGNPAVRERIRVVQSNYQRKESKKEPELSDQEKLDLLLDKIGDVGLQGLSRKEKEELKRLSGD